MTKDVHVIRDATRGGVGTVLYEIAEQSKTGIRLNAEAIPVQDSVKGVCGMLGLEPLYLACEGRLVHFCTKGKCRSNRKLNYEKESILQKLQLLVK